MVHLSCNMSVKVQCEGACGRVAFVANRGRRLRCGWRVMGNRFNVCVIWWLPFSIGNVSLNVLIWS